MRDLQKPSCSESQCYGIVLVVFDTHDIDKYLLARNHGNVLVSGSVLKSVMKLSIHTLFNVFKKRTHRYMTFVVCNTVESSKRTSPWASVTWRCRGSSWSRGDPLRVVTIRQRNNRRTVDII